MTTIRNRDHILQSFAGFNFKGAFPIVDDFIEIVESNKKEHKSIIDDLEDAEEEWLVNWGQPVPKKQRRPIFEPIKFFDIVDIDEYRENHNMWNVLSKMGIMKGDKKRYYENHTIACHEIKEDCLSMTPVEVYNKWTLPQSKYDFIFLTARPLESMTLKEFRKINKKIFSKCWIRDFKLVYEQVGKEERDIGNGAHIHALINVIPTKEMAQANRELKDSYYKKKINVESKLFIEQFRNEKTEYIASDTKNDSEKDKALPFDQIWRTANDLSYVISTIDEI